MKTPSRFAAITKLWAQAAAFLGNFTRFAGVRMWKAIGLVGFAAVLDGAGVVLLIPILDAVVNPNGGHFQIRVVLAFFDSGGLHRQC